MRRRGTGRSQGAAANWLSENALALQEYVAAHEAVARLLGGGPCLAGGTATIITSRLAATCGSRSSMTFFQGSELELGEEGLCNHGIKRHRSNFFERLLRCTQEQIAVLVRLAIGRHARRKADSRAIP